MTKSYIVKGANILHNKKTYGIGSTIDLADDEAKKIADYITPIKAKPQSTPPVATGDTGTTADKNVTPIKKSNKKSDKSLNTADSSDSSTTTTDITPTADPNAVSSNADSVSAEDTVSGVAKQETTNDETVQTTTN